MNKKTTIHTYQRFLIIAICFLSIPPLYILIHNFYTADKKIILISAEKMKLIDSISIQLVDENTQSQNIANNKATTENFNFIKNEFWFLREGEFDNIELPVSNQCNQFLVSLTEERKLSLITKKIKNWEKYHLHESQANSVSFFSDTMQVFKLYTGIINEEKNLIYFRGEKSSVYQGENFFSLFSHINLDIEQSRKSKIQSLVDTKWLPTYLGLTRNSIQRIIISIDSSINPSIDPSISNKNMRVYSKGDSEWEKVLERILGSSGSLVLDKSSIEILQKTKKPSMEIKVENENLKDFIIQIYEQIDEQEEIKDSIQSGAEENTEVVKNRSFIVIPPNAFYGLEISQWSIQQITNTDNQR